MLIKPTDLCNLIMGRMLRSLPFRRSFRYTMKDYIYHVTTKRAICINYEVKLDARFVICSSKFDILPTMKLSLHVILVSSIAVKAHSIFQV